MVSSIKHIEIILGKALYAIKIKKHPDPEGLQGARRTRVMHLRLGDLACPGSSSYRAAYTEATPTVMPPQT